MLASTWFAPMFALAQTLRHVSMLAHGYWIANQSAKNFDAWEFIRRDLSRPLFEPFDFCGAWTHHDFGQAAVISLDLPVYLIVTILHSALTGQASCVDALTTPRGHVVTATLAFPIWFLAGLGLRRFGLEAWRSPARSAVLRRALSFLLPFGALGCLLLVLGAVAAPVAAPVAGPVCLFVSSVWGFGSPGRERWPRNAFVCGRSTS